MALLDLPTQIVESAESLVETKFKITVHLLNIYYRNQKQPEHIPELLENYDIIYKHLKSLTPKPQANYYAKHFKVFIIGFFILTGVLILTLGLLLYKFGFNQITEVISKFFS